MNIIGELGDGKRTYKDAFVSVKENVWQPNGDDDDAGRSTLSPRQGNGDASKP